MKKKLVVCVAALVCLNSVGGSVVYGQKVDTIETTHVITESNKKQVYDLMELGTETYDENGNLVSDDIELFAWGINGSDIAAGKTKYYFPPNQSQGFDLDRGQTVKVSLKLPKSDKVAIGLTSGNQIIVYGSNPSAYLTATSDGRGKVYVTNLNSYDIVVNGTIEY